jgi:UDP-N-acetylglucosamine kinase
MPNANGPAVAHWVRACIDHALTHRYSLVLEGTFRDPDVVATTVRCFASAGYHTEAVVLAVRPERSRLDCLLRWLGSSPAEPARWTPPTAHDTSFTRLPDTVAALNDVTALDRITVQTRTQVVFTDERQADGQWLRPNQAASILRAQHRQPLDPEGATAWLTSTTGQSRHQNSCPPSTPAQFLPTWRCSRTPIASPQWPPRAPLTRAASTPTHNAERQQSCIDTTHRSPDERFHPRQGFCPPPARSGCRSHHQSRAPLRTTATYARTPGAT